MTSEQRTFESIIDDSKLKFNLIDSNDAIKAYEYYTEFYYNDNKSTLIQVKLLQDYSVDIICIINGKDKYCANIKYPYNLLEKVVNTSWVQNHYKVKLDTDYDCDCKIPNFEKLFDIACERKTEKLKNSILRLNSKAALLDDNSNAGIEISYDFDIEYDHNQIKISSFTDIKPDVLEEINNIYNEYFFNQLSKDWINSWPKNFPNATVNVYFQKRFKKYKEIYE